LQSGEVQSRLDALFGVTAEDREQLGRGEVPLSHERLQTVRGAMAGTLLVLFILVGLPGGWALAGRLAPGLGLSAAQARGVATLLLLVGGPLLAFALTRLARPQLERWARRIQGLGVEAEALEFQLVRDWAYLGDGQWNVTPLLKAADGRQFQLPPEFLPLRLAGRLRAYFLVHPANLPWAERPRTLVALEPLGKVDFGPGEPLAPPTAANVPALPPGRRTVPPLHRERRIRGLDMLGMAISGAGALLALHNGLHSALFNGNGGWGFLAAWLGFILLLRRQSGVAAFGGGLILATLVLLAGFGLGGLLR
jgi:hypothetical protein